MRSTGEVMGIDVTFGLAFAKSQIAAGDKLPEGGGVFLSLADRDKPGGLIAARRFAELGFSLIATSGTAAYLEAHGISVEKVLGKLGDGDGEETAVDLIAAGKVQLVVNTPRGSGPRADGAYIRSAAAAKGVPCITTTSAAIAAANGMDDWSTHELRVRTLQEYHAVDQLDLGLP
jgi:carbamoyl-phosphate synthase large subunit